MYTSIMQYYTTVAIIYDTNVQFSYLGVEKNI